MSEYSAERPAATSVASGGKKVYTVEDALELIGGFGAFQWVMCSITFAGYLRSGFVYYPLPYMELLPQFDCLDQITGTW